MAKPSASARTTDDSGVEKSREADKDKTIDAITNLPDECGDSLWDAVLAQKAPDLLQIKKSDMKKDANIKNQPGQTSGT